MDAKRKRCRIHGIQRNALGAERLGKHSRAAQNYRSRLAINDQRSGACGLQKRAGGERLLPRIAAVR